MTASPAWSWKTWPLTAAAPRPRAAPNAPAAARLTAGLLFHSHLLPGKFRSSRALGAAARGHLLVTTLVRVKNRTPSGP